MAVVIPTFSLDLAPPGRMEMPNIVGASIETGRSLSGITGAADISGGGLVTVKYSNIQLGNANPAALKYWSYLALILNGGQRSIYVPLLTDFIAPRPGNGPLYRQVPFSDGSGFSQIDPASDPFSQPNIFNMPNVFGNTINTVSSYFSESTISAMSVGSADLNAGAIIIKVLAGDTLVGGEWFEIQHPTKLYRVYGITDIDSSNYNPNDGTCTYNIGIRPTLREAVTDGTTIKFDRPRCTMRIQAGSKISVDVEKYWFGTPEVTFIESFP
jgi:hypothetical protein